MWKLGLLWWKFKKEILMVWAMLRNPAAPALSKLVVLLVAVYIISPVDLVPDVIPILGWLDDGVIAMLLFKLAFKLLPKEMYESLKAQFEKKGGKVDDATFIKTEPIKTESAETKEQHRRFYTSGTKIDDVVDVKPKR